MHHFDPALRLNIVPVVSREEREEKEGKKRLGAVASYFLCVKPIALLFRLGATIVLCTVYGTVNETCERNCEPNSKVSLHCKHPSAATEYHKTVERRDTV